MPGPIQHLTPFVIVRDLGGEADAGLNTDRPAGYPNAWSPGDAMTDPSTNNQVEGAGIIRNQLVVDMGILMRTFRVGGSGRPQYRTVGAIEACISRVYTIRSESNYQFMLTTHMLPLTGSAWVTILEAAGIEFTADPLLWVWSGAQVPTESQVNVLAGEDTGWIAAGATCIGTTDGSC